MRGIPSSILSSLIAATCITIGVIVASPMGPNILVDVIYSHRWYPLWIFIITFIVFLLIHLIAAIAIYIITTPSNMKHEDGR